MKLEQLKKLLLVLILLHLRKTYAFFPFTLSIRDYQKENSMEEQGVLVQLTKKDLIVPH